MTALLLLLLPACVPGRCPPPYYSDEAEPVAVWREDLEAKVQDAAAPTMAECEAVCQPVHKFFGCEIPILDPPDTADPEDELVYVQCAERRPIVCL